MMVIKHCVTCGELLEQNDDTCYQCPYGHQYFNNPRCGASIIFLRDDGKFLAAKRAIEPQKGKYGLIGGFLQFGESPQDAARREAKEETGVDVTELEMITTSPHIYQANESTVTIIFLARQWQGEFQPGDDAAQLAWKPLGFLTSEEFAWPEPELLEKLQAIDMAGKP